MEMMKDFIMAALPWVIMGISLAVFSVKNFKNEDPDEKPAENYGAFGMCIGMSIGYSVGMALDRSITWMAPGIMIGLTVGSFIEKKKA